MKISKYQFGILVAFATLSPSTQVTISIEWWNRGHLWSIAGNYIGTCINIPPGDCCKPHRDFLPPPDEIGLSVVRFGTLLLSQFGAGWGASGPHYEDIPQCIGPPILRIFGPQDEATYQIPDDPPAPDSPTLSDSQHPDATWDDFSTDWEDSLSGEPHEIIFSAAWIDLRTRFPPDPYGTRYLQYQGVKSLVWGKNTWSANSDGVPFPKRDGKVKINQWARRGEVTLHTPRRWRYPDSYTINGTLFTIGGDGLYRNPKGATLPLTPLPRLT